MGKKRFSFSTRNRLSSYLKQDQKRYEETHGEKILLSTLEERLATHCELTRKSIVDIKRGENQPSLPVAFRICRYFDVPMEAMFAFITKEDEIMEKLKTLHQALDELKDPIDKVNEALTDINEGTSHDYDDFFASEKEDGDTMTPEDNLARIREWYRTLPVEDEVTEIQERVASLIKVAEERKQEKPRF